MTTAPALPYAGLGAEDLLPLIRQHLADVAERLDFAPVADDLDLDRAVALLDALAEQQPPAHLADSHRQIGYAAWELHRCAKFTAKGNTDLADAFARTAALYLDQAVTSSDYAEQNLGVDPLDLIEADLAEIRRHIVQTLAPGLGRPAPTDPAYTLATAGCALVELRDICTVTTVKEPELALAHDHVAVRQQLGEAIELLSSAHRNAPAGVPAAAGEITGRIHQAAAFVAGAARTLQQATAR